MLQFIHRFFDGQSSSEIADLFTVLNDVQPVSYTHLDVYKRQFMPSQRGGKHASLIVLLKFSVLRKPILGITLIHDTILLILYQGGVSLTFCAIVRFGGTVPLVCLNLPSPILFHPFYLLIRRLLKSLRKRNITITSL